MEPPSGLTLKRTLKTMKVWTLSEGPRGVNFDDVRGLDAPAIQKKKV